MIGPETVIPSSPLKSIKYMPAIIADLFQKFEANAFLPKGKVMPAIGADPKLFEETSEDNGTPP